jgi:hypothetical protein
METTPRGVSRYRSAHFGGQIMFQRFYSIAIAIAGVTILVASNAARPALEEVSGDSLERYLAAC